MTGFIGILNNPSCSLNSHNAGWNNIIRKLIDKDSIILTEKNDWNNYNRLIINHGLNFKPGIFNVIGGIGDEVHLRINKFLNFNGEIFQIDGFQIKDFIIKRKLSYQYNKEISSIQIPKKEKLLIGDSHSVSVWPNENWNINRMDGKTLFGFLKNPVKADYYYFGNIDIRFHLGRQSDPMSSTINLVERYIELVKENNSKVSCLLPVESETRKLPGSGKYNGVNFNGSLRLRSELVSIFNDKLINSGLDVNIWPEKWYNDIHFYEKEVLEPKQSVHIRPKYYANK